MLTGIPTIGVGKTFLFVDGLSIKPVKAQVEKECKKGGDYIELVGESGTVWGAVCPISFSMTQRERKKQQFNGSTQATFIKQQKLSNNSNRNLAI